MEDNKEYYSYISYKREDKKRDNKGLAPVS